MKLYIHYWHSGDLTEPVVTFFKDAEPACVAHYETVGDTGPGEKNCVFELDTDKIPSGYGGLDISELEEL